MGKSGRDDAYAPSCLVFARLVVPLNRSVAEAGWARDFREVPGDPGCGRLGAPAGVIVIVPDVGPMAQYRGRTAVGHCVRLFDSAK